MPEKEKSEITGGSKEFRDAGEEQIKEMGKKVEPKSTSTDTKTDTNKKTK